MSMITFVCEASILLCPKWLEKKERAGGGLDPPSNVKTPEKRERAPSGERSWRILRGREPGADAHRAHGAQGGGGFLKNAPALLIEATEVRDSLDAWLALEVPFRFCL